MFEFIFQLMAPNSDIYMDGYFGSTTVIAQFAVFTKELAERRRIGCAYVCNAGGLFGALFRLYDSRPQPRPLVMQ